MPMNWNDAADVKLFAGVLATTENIKLNYKELADWMGTDCTEKAIRNRMTYVRKMTKDTETNVAKAPKTPTTSGKRKPTKDVEVHGASDGDESPTKPKKARAARKSKAKVKAPAEAEVAMDSGEDGTDEVKDGSGDEMKTENGEEGEAA